MLAAALSVMIIGVSLAGTAPGERPTAGAPTRDVANAVQLTAALARARGGEHIRLAPGRYGSLRIQDRRFDVPVRIVGPAGQSKAHFDVLRIAGSKGLRLEGLDVGQALPASDGAYLRIQDSSDVGISGSAVHGSLDRDPRNDGIGIHIAKSDNVFVTASEVHDAQIGIMIAASSRIKATGNLLHFIRSDGIISGGSDQLLFAGNYITDFVPNPEDHSDGIQLHNTGTLKGTSDVVITNNVILQGAGGRLQGIWVSDGSKFPHRNITITNNLIYINDYHNGIGMAYTETATIANNTVVSETKDKEMAWIRVKLSKDIIVENNVSDAFFDPENVAGLQVRNNFFASRDKARRCSFRNLDGMASTTVPDLLVNDIGFKPNKDIHPALWQQFQKPAKSPVALSNCGQPRK